jgi:transcriptional regulator with XRE-family HTH domain
MGIVLDRSAIARIENGERYVLDYEADGLATALKVSVAELYKVARNPFRVDDERIHRSQRRSA